MDSPFWNGVWALGWKLDRLGCVLPMTDLCMAHLAMSHRAVLVTRDRHFRSIPNLAVSAQLPD